MIMSRSHSLFRACFLGMAGLVWAMVPAQINAQDFAKTLGQVAVMEAGRIKPLDTVARHEVKQIYGRETIKLTGVDGSVSKWGPVAAFIDWQMPNRDDFWDNQPFILTEFVPLKEKLLAESIREALKAAAADASTEAAAKSALETLVKDEIITHDSLKNLLATAKLPAAHQSVLESFSKKLDVGSKWMTPKDLETSKVIVDGRSLEFKDWFRNLVGKKNGGGMGGTPTKLTEVENRAYETGGRLVHYTGIRDRTGLGKSPIFTVMPRPSSEAYLKFTSQALKKAIDGQETAMTPMERDAAEALDRYFEDIPKSDRAMPGTKPDFDKKYSIWLSGKSPWIPLNTIMEADDAELASAGFAADKAKAMREAFRKMEAEAQESKTGEISNATALSFSAAARQLGEGVGVYPSVASLARETHFNSFAPFFQAPTIYGAGLFFLLFCLVFTGIGEKSGGLFAKLGKATYLVGMAAFIGGIAIEIYGFYLRIMISGWAPVTNMYETVIWVALVTAVLGLALELIYRKIYAATAATGVALMATLLAANVSLLDPEIRSLQPVLRSNYWLTIHVLTIVSSYAAFALALGLGLLATGYYLTATYRRSPGFVQLIAPALAGLPIGLFGYLAVTGKAGEFVTSETGYYISFLTALAGMMLVVASVSSILGELIARALFRSYEAAGVVNMAVEFDEESAETESLQSAQVEGLKKANAAGTTAVMEPPSKVVKSKAANLVDQIRKSSTQAMEPTSPRERSMMNTAAKIKPLSTFIYRAMQVGVLLVAAGTILGGVWADYSWGRFWGWDPKEVWALIVLLVYLVPLHGRFAGWVNTFGLVASSVVCFMSVMMAWYGVNFVLGVGLHSYGFVEGGSQGVVMTAIAAVCAVVGGAWWRRHLGQKVTA
jgi:ABC-type transport system involved in cytochrome c biogenesis permease subunit